jgi:hypothetical protein
VKQESLFDRPASEPQNALGLPAEVLCIALNQPYADLVVGGVKTLETRTWEWPYPPSWLAIYATKTPDKAAMARLGPAHQEVLVAPLGGIVGVVFIAGCRRMAYEDQAAACFPFEAGRYVWTIERPHQFRTPVRDYLDRGPQKFVRVPRCVILAGLAP